MRSILILLIVVTVAAVESKKSAARIIGGTATTISQVPYLVSIRINGRTVCGGTLVNSRFVVTAAHCVKSERRSSLTVVGGTTTLSSGGVTRTVSKVITPKSYRASTMHNDVAVLKLSSAMSGSNIQPIGLCNSALKSGSYGQVSGWGLTRESGSGLSTRVRTVRLPIISTSQCKRKYRGRASVTSTMVCTSISGKDACTGDSGGPLIYNGRLCGIVSWGIGCARKNSPGVYTNVRKVSSFIRNSLRK